MERLQSPKDAFWPYDIFGYLLPGAIFCTSLTLGHRMGSRLAEIDLGLNGVARYMAALVALYVTGHVVAATASLVMERWVLRKCWGYPTQFMFKANASGSHTQEGNSNKNRPRKRDWVIEILAPGYTRSYSDGFIALFDRMLGRLAPSDTSKPLDGLHDRFWLSWEYISLRHPAAYRRATHFLELYGFSRNSSMAFLLATLIPALPGWGAPIAWWVWCLVCLGSGIALWANYVKLLRRMNDEVFRGFTVAASLEFSGPVAGQNS